ncbi:TonB-dependent receptor family protein [Azomonas macrocytogenes]|uniref:Iron complex outermembrane receptor protein n=1 Tax=Azomonas macrocytogenes TaxID=69962 RepID=A0A839T466_AZOMA|nr:TonB-dependent receptor [Azomonas macrocytogenes]MBB3103124.1 iron complex outermembrane receptor protein [Azomonas macrocytogenes]
MRHLSTQGLLTLCISFAAVAQAEQLELDQTTIAGTHKPDPTAPTLAEKKADLAKVPGGANVVDAETYKSGRSSTVQDALGLATGVFVQPRFGSEESRLSIRGSGLQRTFHGRGILLMQDGAPVNLGDGSFDFQVIEPLATQYIEVLRGANAWRYGVTSLGGSVNFVTPTGKTAPTADVRYEQGSFDYHRTYAAFGQDFGNWDAFVSLSDSIQDGFRDHSRQDNQRYFANLGGRLGERLATRFYLTHVETDSELPGNLTKKQLRKDREQAAASNISGDQKRDFTLNRVGNISVLELDGGHSLSLATFYSHKSLLHPIYQVLDVDSDDYGLRLTHKWQNDRGWRWNGGIDLTHGRNHDSRYLNVRGHKGRKVNEFIQTARNMSVFGELEIPLAERWALIGGLTWIHQERDVDDRLRCNAAVSTSCVYQDESFNKTYVGRIGRLGLRYDLAENVQLFANFSQSYEPPTFSELTGGQVLTSNDAQRARTFEAGMRFSHGSLDLDLAIYRSELRDELLSLNDSTGQPLGTLNADKTIHQGLELGGALTLGQFALRGQYLYNDFRFDNDKVYGDHQIAGMPKQFLKGEVMWQRNGWYAGPTFEWVPTHYNVDHAETLYADAYALWGLKAGYRPDKGFGFFIEGRNLSDRTYSSTTGVIADAKGQDSAQFLPGDGRSLYMGVQWRM